MRARRFVIVAGLSAAAFGTANIGSFAGATTVGQDPQASGCATASGTTTMVGSDYSGGGGAWRLELRYSPVCQMGWSRVTTYPGSGNMGYTLAAWNPGSPSVYTVAGSGATAWTGMVNASPGHQVCGGAQVYHNGAHVGWYFLGCFSR